MRYTSFQGVFFLRAVPEKTTRGQALANQKMREASERRTNGDPEELCHRGTKTSTKSGDKDS